MDDAVEHFMAFTGASADVARRYLGLTENNSEQAVQLFFDSPELASGVDQPPPSAAPPIPTSTRLQAGNTAAGGKTSKETDLIDLSDDEDDTTMDVDDEGEEEAASRAAAAAAAHAADVEDDEAMARRMQEELYAGGDGSGGYDADGVRAPIGRRTETLVGGPDGDWAPDDMHAAVLQQMRARQRQRKY